VSKRFDKLGTKAAENSEIFLIPSLLFPVHLQKMESCCL
jgi:hypothetical protein